MLPEFTHPLFLLPALLIPPLVWWWLQQRRGALRYPDTGWLTQLPAGRSTRARWGGALLRAAGLFLIVVALAGPRWPDRRTRIPTEGISIMMVTDVSGSMAEPDFDWHGQPISRLEAVKRVFRVFVGGGEADDGSRFEGRPSDLVGLVVFATRPEDPCPLTLSHSVLLQLLEAQQPRSIPGESETNISDAIILGLTRLQHSSTRRKILILLSDGEHNVPHPASGWTPRQTVQVAANLHVPIYTIDAGGPVDAEPQPGNGVSPETRKEGVHTLEQIARMTGGHYFRAGDGASLLQACQKIDQLERTQIQSFQYRRYVEGFPYLGLGSFALWMTACGLEMTFWRRSP